MIAQATAYAPPDGKPKVTGEMTYTVVTSKGPEPWKPEFSIRHYTVKELEASLSFALSNDSTGFIVQLTGYKLESTTMVHRGNVREFKCAMEGMDMAITQDIKLAKRDGEKFHCFSKSRSG